MTYEWDPADYQQNSAAQLDFAAELIAKLRLLGEERVLDIGCGDGKVTAAIARLVPNGSAVGLDSSRAPVLAGIFEALKPAGRFLIQMGGKGNAAGIIEVADDVIKRPEWRPYFNDFPFPYGFYTPREYIAWAEEAGLVIDRAELVPKVVAHADRAALEGWFRTTWMPYLDRVRASRQAAFINRVIDAYVKLHPADDAGAVRVNMVRLEIEGHKL